MLCKAPKYRLRSDRWPGHRSWWSGWFIMWFSIRSHNRSTKSCTCSELSGEGRTFFLFFFSFNTPSHPWRLYQEEGGAGKLTTRYTFAELEAQICHFKLTCILQRKHLPVFGLKTTAATISKQTTTTNKQTNNSPPPNNNKKGIFFTATNKLFNPRPSVWLMQRWTLQLFAREHSSGSPITTSITCFSDFVLDLFTSSVTLSPLMT